MFSMFFIKKKIEQNMLFMFSFSLFVKTKLVFKNYKQRACLVLIFKNRFLFSVLKNNEDKENKKNIFGS